MYPRSGGFCMYSWVVWVFVFRIICSIITCCKWEKITPMGILNWEPYFFITCLSQYSLWHFLFSGKQRNIVRLKHPRRNIFTDTNRCPSMKPMKWLIVIFTSTTTSASRQRPEWRRWRCATPLKLHIAYMGFFMLTAQTGAVQFAERVLFARLCEFRRFLFCIYSC